MSHAGLTIGVLGVGHLIRHMMPALVRGVAGDRLLLSPRNAAVADTLSKRYGLAIAPDTATLVARSDVVLLAVRPPQVAEATEALPWRQGQIAVSLCAGVPRAVLRATIRGPNIVRAMPVIAAEFGESPTCIFPDNDVARSLLASCGPVLPLMSEEAFETASVSACYFGWVLALIDQMAQATAAQGLDPETSRLLVAQMTRAAATIARERTDASTAQLVEELASPGSFTLTGLEVLRDNRAFDAWHQAFHAVLQRLRDR